METLPHGGARFRYNACKEMEKMAFMLIAKLRVGRKIGRRRSSWRGEVPILSLWGDGNGVHADYKVRSAAKSLKKPFKWWSGGSDTVFVGRWCLYRASCIGRELGRHECRVSYKWVYVRRRKCRIKDVMYNSILTKNGKIVLTNILVYNIIATTNRRGK
jgi:hypothetical protein